jgi:hypothetical protein
MDNFQVVVYVIIVVIYIISRVMKAKKKADLPSPPFPGSLPNQGAPSTDSQPKPFTTSRDPRQMTFEDLLKEFTGNKEEQTEVVSGPPAQEQQYKTISRETMTSETRPLSDPNPYEYSSPYENTSPYGTPAEERYHPEEYETIKSYDDSPVTSNKVTESDTRPVDENKARFSAYATFKGRDLHTANRFKKLLQNRITVKDAVVLKEILETKYF